MTSFWQDIDLTVLRFFNGSENLMLDEFAMMFTSGATWIPLYLVLFYIVVRNHENLVNIGLVVLGATFCVMFADGMADGIVKPLVERYRPCNDPFIKYSIHVVDGYRSSGYSFFSAHAANTMSITLYFTLVIRSKLLTVTMFAWSFANCWTRLYLGQHYPSDIIVGIAWGLLAGYVAYRVYTKLCNKQSLSPTLSARATHTITGYKHDDIHLVMCTMTIILLYIIVCAFIKAS